MIENTADLVTTLDKVHTTMRACKTKYKIGAYLINITDLRPITMNKTRWSGKIIMLKRFIKIHSELKLCLIDGIEIFELDVTNLFKAKVEMYIKMLEKIDKVTVRLQEKNLTLSKQRAILNVLIDKVANANHNDALYDSGLGKQCDCIYAILFIYNKNVLFYLT